MGVRTLCIVLVAVIGQAVAAASVPATTPPPLSYTCDTKGNVSIITGALFRAQYKRLAVYGSKTGLKEAGGNSGISNSCSKDLASFTAQSINLTACKLGDPIYVYVMKENASNIYGGHAFHEYILKCEIPKTGVHQNATVHGNVNVSNTSAPVTETQTPVIEPTMSITPNTGVTIGAEMTLTITLGNISNANTLHVLPKNCSAQPVLQSANSGSPLTLSLLTDGKTADSEIMTNFDVSKTGISSATVYAFRFTDSPTVSIECFVFICTSVNCEPTLAGYTAKPAQTTTGGSNRRRRSRLMPQKPAKPSGHKVQTVFTVKENHPIKTSGQTKVLSSSLTVLAMAVSLLVN